ncbi:MAG TPA: TonB-dependent receptor [Methylococcaceae bacterium]|nr:TonB-dependent receptor [Methylococcaceae bacterium]
MSRRLPRYLYSLFACASAAAVAGDLTDLPLEELSNTGLATFSPNVEVSTAAKYAQLSAEAPAAVRVVTAQDIKTYGYRTLAEVLRSLPGVYVSHDRNYSYLGVRGFSPPGDYNARVLMLVDGVRFNENIYDSLSLGHDFILDIDLVERVEFMPGPGSALYGNNALFGVVNVITKRGASLDGAELSGDYGGFDTYKARGSFGRRFDNGAELLLSATGFDREGPDRLHFKEFDTPGRNGGNAVGLDFDRYQSAFGKFSLGGLNLESAYISRDKGIPTASFGQAFNDPRSATLDQRGFVAMTYNTQWGPAWDFRARLDYQRYWYDGDYAYPDALNRDVARGEWWGGELQVINTSFEDHRLSFGGEWQDNLQQFQSNRDVGGAVFVDAPYNSVRYGFYGEDQFRLLDELTLIAGARYDYVPLGGSSANPRLGLVWQAREDTTLRLNYGTAFRAPNTFERFYNDPAGNSGYKPNASLNNETVETLELGLQHLLTPATRLGLSVYHYEADGLISQTADADGFLIYRNLDGIKAVGVEADGEHRFKNGVRTRLSYAWQETRDDTGAILTNSPQHMAKFHIDSPLWREGWTLGFDTLYLGSRQGRLDTVDGHVLSSLTLNSRWLENADLSAGVYNLWNAHYADPVGSEFVQNEIFQDGRSFRLKLTLRF